ncbi:hypothetical protein [Marixanthomonas spongiae]|uniref:hypothetical protein n=1 Tax=Marixanthomonas spongiae TaxID=2174845 RepID=UPI00105830CF|nr:hypothetical protein [Marixanthomonas spongiae]
MASFKIPRKLKKRLKKGLWLYPSDADGNSTMAFPYRCQEDFTAYKKGTLRNLADTYNSRKRRIAFRRKIEGEVVVPDEELKTYVNAIIRKDLRRSSYETLIRAKNSKKAIGAYYNFVNAYQLVEKGEDSFGNICCLAIDKAKELLKN